jgi:cob(I)alamin adenosyltransferase
MILWDKVKKSFDAGMDILRRVAVLASERVRIESTVARHLIDKGTLESRLAKVKEELGDRIFELRERGAEDYLNDQEVQTLFKDIDALNADIEDLSLKIRKITLGEEVD